MKLLNIGAGPATIPIPPWYHDWDIVRLDMEKANTPDLLMDAMDLDKLEPGQYDAAYASHLLEHIYTFYLGRFLSGVRHVLTANGFAEFHVPNVLEACKAVAEAGTLDAFCYQSPAGPITAWDMLYSYRPFLERWGEPMAHHNGFSPTSLSDTLNQYGFPLVYMKDTKWDIGAFGCKADLPDEMKRRMSIDRATGTDSPVHSDVRAADVGLVRFVRTMAEPPLQHHPTPGGNGPETTALAARGRGAILPGSTGLGRRL